jgi:hypothetical protein
MLGYRFYFGLAAAILCGLLFIINRFGLFAALT